MMEINAQGKGLILTFWKDAWGNYSVEINSEGGFLELVNTHEKTKGEARKVAQGYVKSELISLQKKSRKQAESHQKYLTRIHSNR